MAEAELNRNERDKSLPSSLDQSDAISTDRRHEKEAARYHTRRVVSNRDF